MQKRVHYAEGEDIYRAIELPNGSIMGAHRVVGAREMRSPKRLAYFLQQAFEAGRASMAADVRQLIGAKSDD